MPNQASYVSSSAPSAQSGNYQTYQVSGMREDLSDIIYRISPTTTPAVSAFSKEKSAQTFHEWQTQDLAAFGVNAAIEGADMGSSSITPTARLGNYTQILTKPVQVSGTNQQVNMAGRNNELSYQLSLKGLEIRRDLEAAVTGCANGVAGAASGGTYNAGAAATARVMRSLEGWVATCSDLGASGAAPNYYTNTGPTDGTAAALTETRLKNVLQQIYTQGGDPDMILCGAGQKQVISTFTGPNITKYLDTADKKITAAIDVYVSDFGQLKIVPTRFVRNRSVFVLQSDMWALANLRPFTALDIAKSGDSDKRMLIVETTLVARQEKASGVVRDCS